MSSAPRQSRKVPDAGKSSNNGAGQASSARSDVSDAPRRPRFAPAGWDLPHRGLPPPAPRFPPPSASPIPRSQPRRRSSSPGRTTAEDDLDSRRRKMNPNSLANLRKGGIQEHLARKRAKRASRGGVETTSDSSEDSDHQEDLDRLTVGQTGSSADVEDESSFNDSSVADQNARAPSSGHSKRSRANGTAQQSNAQFQTDDGSRSFARSPATSNPPVFSTSALDGPSSTSERQLSFRPSRHEVSRREHTPEAPGLPPNPRPSSTHPSSTSTTVARPSTSIAHGAEIPAVSSSGSIDPALRADSGSDWEWESDDEEPRVSANPADRAGEAERGNIKAKRAKAKPGEGARAANFRKSIARLQREKDPEKMKEGYERLWPQLQRQFLKITRQFGAEGFLFIGHPLIATEPQDPQLDGAENMTSDGLVDKECVSEAFADTNRHISTNKIQFESEMPFARDPSGPMDVSMQAITSSIRKLVGVSLQKLQQSNTARLQELHRECEQAAKQAEEAREQAEEAREQAEEAREQAEEAREQAEAAKEKAKEVDEAMRRYLRRQGMSEEEINETIQQEKKQIEEECERREIADIGGMDEYDGDDATMTPRLGREGSCESRICV